MAILTSSLLVLLPLLRGTRGGVAASAATVAVAAPSSCSFSTPAGAFDLAPLGAVRTGAQDAAHPGRSYLLSACADVDAAAAAGFCGGGFNAPAPAPAPALQATDDGTCRVLGRLAQRSVSPLAANDSGSGRMGVTVAFGGGDACDGELARSIVINIMCADVALSRAVLVAESAERACAYTFSVESRAGCPLACARDAATGAVCGGEGRGECSMGAAAGGAAACKCKRGHSGPDCAATTVRSRAVLRRLGGEQSTAAEFSFLNWLPVVVVIALVAAMIFRVLRLVVESAFLALSSHTVVDAAGPPHIDTTIYVKGTEGQLRPAALFAVLLSSPKRASVRAMEV
jgi:hypothetical protein